MGNTESLRREPGGEFVTVRDGIVIKELEEDQLMLQHLNELHSTLPLLKMPGESSWREMLPEADGLVEHGVGAINTGGMASMLDSYQEWSTSRLIEVNDQQRAVIAKVNQAEMTTANVMTRLSRCYHTLERSNQQLDQVRNLGEELARMQQQINATVLLYQSLVDGLDIDAEAEGIEISIMPGVQVVDNVDR